MPRKARTESIANTDAAPGGAAAVDRALSLLAAFRQGDKSLTLSTLAERTLLYKSTVLRLLASLEHGGIVQRLEDDRYTLGPGIARLHAVYASSFSLDRVILPALRELVRLTEESAAYHVRQGNARLCLYRVDSPHPVRDHIKAGDVLPADRGTGARVLNAFGAPALRAGTEIGQTLYNRIRHQGYYAATGDRLAEVAGISAPVFKADGTLGGALTLTMPKSRYDEKHIQSVLAVASGLKGRV
jgi:DNA-binding IclR family transcriptional regulator